MNKISFWLTVLALPLGVGLASAANAASIPPRDECLELDGYYQFRQNLEGIVKRRDAKGLSALVDPQIKWSFGGDDGKENFLSQWKLAKGAASPIWAEFEAMLPLGCGKQGDGIVFPYFFTQDLGLGTDGSDAGLVTGPSVNLRAGPSTSSASKGKLGWEVVTYTGSSPDGLWHQVKTGSGQTGYVKDTYLRDAWGHRAGFTAKNGKWMMTFFVAGD